MPDSYRKTLFENYHSTHEGYMDLDDKTTGDWFLDYVRENYLPLLKDMDRSGTTILEIGCNKGFALLGLKSLGFTRLFGVDRSPDDIQKAKALLPSAHLFCADAYPYLQKNKKKFDVILLKAVLEHIPKNEVVPFLKRIKEGLKEGGVIIVDVPNMDWMAANHERYMDFTHEVGFTRESLGQVLRNVFTSVSIGKGRSVFSTGLKGLARAVVRPLFLFVATLVLRIVGEGAADIWWDCRSIIGSGKK